MLFLSGVLLIAAGAFALSSHESNNYVENVIDSLKDEIRYNQLDPAELSSFDDVIKSPGLLPWIKTNYNHGKLYGLTNVQRLSDCSAPYFASGNITIDCSLTIKDLKVEYDGKAKYQMLPTFSYKAKASIPETSLRVQVTTATSHNLPQLRNMVERLSEINVTFSGIVPLRVLEKRLRNAFVKKLEEILRRFFLWFSEAFNRSVGRHAMPSP